MITALEALQRLREGNRRFATDTGGRREMSSQAQREAIAREQKPFAVILSCSDARVPTEIVFDQGLGDLFVIRVAGNIVAPSQIGSVEYAAEQTGARLVVVLGHSSCGAVIATLEQLEQPIDARSPNLSAIVDRIKPAVTELLDSDAHHDPESLVRRAVRANVHMSVDHLRHGSKILEQLIERDGLVVVGAEYSLDTGLVEFFDQ